MITLRECADKAAAALVEMLRSAKEAVDNVAVADVIEQVAKSGDERNRGGCPATLGRPAGLDAGAVEAAARCLAGGYQQTGLASWKSRAAQGVIAAAERLLADGVFDSPDEQKNFEQLLKSYQKLFRTARRMMRLGDHNERQLNAAAEVIAQKNRELELSTKLSKYLSPQVYKSIFTGGAGRRDCLQSQEAHYLLFRRRQFYRDHRQTRSPEDLTNLLNRYLTEMSDIALALRRHRRQIYRRCNHGLLRRS